MRNLVIIICTFQLSTLYSQNSAEIDSYEEQKSNRVHKIQTIKDSLLALNWDAVDSLVLDDGYGMIILKDSLFRYKHDSFGLTKWNEIYTKEIQITLEEFKPVLIEFSTLDTIQGFDPKTNEAIIIIEQTTLKERTIKITNPNKG